MKRILLLSILLLSSSCSLFRHRHCNPEAAMKLGKQDANNWDAKMANYNKGESCDYDDYVKANYRDDYMKSYNLTIKENCSSSNIMSIAKSDALAGKSDFPMLEKLGLCSKAGVGFAKAKKTYMTSFKGSFCKESTAKKVATKDADALRQMNTGQFDKICGSGRLAKKYRKTYIAAFQGVVNKKAQDHVKRDQVRNSDFIDELIRSKSLIKKFKATYTKTYNNEMYKKVRRITTMQAEKDAKAYRLANAEFIQSSKATDAQKIKLEKLYRKNHRAELIKQCNVNKMMTMAKGDARSKRPVEGGMDKINNCPEQTGRATLISSYVKNFNQEKDKMQLEAERQRLQAEKQKLELEKARLARQNSQLQQQNQQLAQQNLHNANWRSGIVNFQVEKKPIRTSCRVNKKNYKVTVINNKGASINLTPFNKWEVVVRDLNGQIIQTKRIESPSKYISWADKKKTLRLRRRGSKKSLKRETSCTAILLKS